jgi:uncharacterized coiled-coil protein SlyX
MAEISKQALKVDNNQSFPNNNNGAITPAILRAFNVNMIDSMVDELGYNVDSASWNVSISNINAFTSSLQTAFVSTASFNAFTSSINAYTASNNTKWNNVEVATASLFTSVTNLNTTTASLLVETQNLELFSASALVSISNLNQATASYVTETESGSFLITASFDNGNRNLTFTKGNNTTFAVNIPDVSGSAGGNFVTTSSFNSYTASTDSRLTNIETTTASLLIETQNLELFSASALTSLSNINQFTQSAGISINSLNAATASYVTETESGSFLLTASFDNGTRNLTFTKGNNTTFAVNIPDVSGSAGDFVTTSSFNSYTASTDSSISQLNASSASQQISIDNLNTTTASLLVETQNLELFSASALVSISNLNTNSASVNTSITNVNSATASLFTSVNNINTFTQSAQTSINSLNSATSSYVTESETASFARTNVSNTFTGDQNFNNNVSILQNLTVTGNLYVSGSEVIISSSTLVVGDRLIEVNANRAIGDAGIYAFDAIGNQTGSLIWDPFVDYWKAGLSGSETRVITAADTASLFANNTGSLLTTASFNAYTQSNDQRVTSLETNSASVNISISALNTYTASQSTASLVTSITNLNTFSASALVSISNLNASSASQQISIDNLNTNSASVNTSVTNLNSATASLFTSTSLSLVTASASGNTITFTKGNTSTFSVTVDTGSAERTIFEVVYTGESITKGDPLYISGSQGANPIVFKADAAVPAKMPVTFVANETIAVANTTEAIVLGLIEGIDLTGYVAGQSIYVAEGGGWSASLPSGSNSVTQLLGVVTKGGSGGKGLVLNPGPAQLPGLDTGLMWVGGASNQAVEITTASFVSSASFNSYTSSNDQKVDSLIAATGSYATTGSNTFTGDQTLTDAAGNFFTISDASGSMMLVAKGFTSASAHLSSSVGGKVNIIWKDNNNTADTIISGSNNIFTNAIAPTAGFKRYIGGSNNLYTATTIPQISGSMQFSPSMNRNIGSFAVPIRGPISSSAYNINDNLVMAGVVNLGTAVSPFTGMVAGYNFTSNILAGGTINQTANVSTLDYAGTFNSNIVFGATLNINNNSSSVNYFSNIQNGGITINNNYVPTVGSVAIRRAVATSINTIYGVNHKMDFGGSNASTASVRSATANLLAGTYVTASLQESGDNSSMYAVNMLGNALIVSGTSACQTGASPLADATYGSMFSGRFNAVDGNKAKTAETIFAVGTGTGYANRKTGFLIDSGSNTFVEGTLNVSGATSLNGDLNITGSLTASLQEGFVYVGNASGITTTVATSSFGGGAAFPFTGSAQITGSLGVTGSVSGFVNTLSISSNTASLDFNNGNFFTLQLVSGSITHLTATNIRPGQTINLLVKTDSGSAAASGSLTFSPTFKFAGGFDYTPTQITASQDLVSFVTFDTTQVLAGQIKNLS